jgi:hypothetical protein
MSTDEEAAALLLKAIMLRLGVDHITIPIHEARYIHARAQTFDIEVAEDETGLHIHLTHRR